MEKLNNGEVITLDDDLDYVFIKRINYNNDDYILLSELENPNNILIQQEAMIDGEITLKGLKDEDEFNLLIDKFSNELQDDLNL